MYEVKQLALLNHIINICLKHTFKNKMVWERKILSNRLLLHMRYKRIISVNNYMTVEYYLHVFFMYSMGITAPIHRLLQGFSQGA